MDVWRWRVSTGLVLSWPHLLARPNCGATSLTRHNHRRRLRLFLVRSFNLLSPLPGNRRLCVWTSKHPGVLLDGLAHFLSEGAFNGISTFRPALRASHISIPFHPIHFTLIHTSWFLKLYSLPSSFSSQHTRLFQSTLSRTTSQNGCHQERR